mmetsp:Transcript_42871/g.100579  ORF Transcript_42871/g.100579 Transcript_42871/m.100579 type:complete len:365 (+) Transcript_42871:185-1279(+)|eukprot:CAMPEP_0178403236 /NCGR_PEP_ID=MMETSP0689_2-20121128/17262_1 /TAXON_ID=160604 /ORGANISM="Amphidinium massartii, Strain CS-259" /LENGTH=364 /DNA_ID=CAMNT_0020024179 /DNA_START=87 /DNA_END=1181 /DNA_ORIENTATION=-
MSRGSLWARSKDAHAQQPCSAIPSEAQGGSGARAPTRSSKTASLGISLKVTEGADALEQDDPGEMWRHENQVREPSPPPAVVPPVSLPPPAASPPFKGVLPPSAGRPSGFQFQRLGITSPVDDDSQEIVDKDGKVDSVSEAETSARSMAHQQSGTLASEEERVRYICIPSESMQGFQKHVQAVTAEVRREAAASNPYAQALRQYREDLEMPSALRIVSLEQRLGTEREALSRLAEGGGSSASSSARCRGSGTASSVPLPTSAIDHWSTSRCGSQGISRAFSWLPWCCVADSQARVAMDKHRSPRIQDGGQPMIHGEELRGIDVSHLGDRSRQDQAVAERSEIRRMLRLHVQSSLGPTAPKMDTG